MKHQKAMQELRAALVKASPAQLAIALAAVAYVHVETFMELHKPPEDTTPAERAELRAALIYHAIAESLNVAAEVALDLRKAAAEPQPSPEDEARASAAADAAIAKAAGKLH